MKNSRSNGSRVKDIAPGLPKRADRPSVVLYVERESYNRIVFHKALDGVFRCVRCATVAEAEDILWSDDVDIVVVSTSHREKHMALLKTLVERRPKLPRVVLGTDSSSTDDLVEDELAHRAVQKPWDRDELERTILECWRESQRPLS